MVVEPCAAMTVRPGSGWRRSMRLATCALALGLLACRSTPPAHVSHWRAPEPGTSTRALFRPVDAVPAVDDADWLAAWPAWLATCDIFQAGRTDADRVWRRFCAKAPRGTNTSASQIRDYFAREARLFQILADDDGAGKAPRELGLMTGYYEPELAGRSTADDHFRYPLYRAPAHQITASRAQIESRRLLAGNELVWLEDPIEAFFVEVQGSALIRLEDGQRIRVGYAGNNGQPYRSIGSWLIEQRELDDNHLSMQNIKSWAQSHPARLRELLDADPRVVFFRAENAAAATGPRGSLGASLTAGVSAAVDPRFVPLGSPLLVVPRQVDGGEHLPVDLMPARVLVAQDTGNAIRGPLRLDWFWGSGAAAEDIAGHQRAFGQMYVFVPGDMRPEDLIRH